MAGEPGYFQQTLSVYGRGGLPCTHCGTLLKDIKLGQRSSVLFPLSALALFLAYQSSG